MYVKDKETRQNWRLAIIISTLPGEFRILGKKENSRNTKDCCCALVANMFSFASSAPKCCHTPKWQHATRACTHYIKHIAMFVRCECDGRARKDKSSKWCFFCLSCAYLRVAYHMWVKINLLSTPKTCRNAYAEKNQGKWWAKYCKKSKENNHVKRICATLYLNDCTISDGNAENRSVAKRIYTLKKKPFFLRASIFVGLTNYCR